MLINKVITGVVVQVWDTIEKKFVEQSFIQTNPVIEYEDAETDEPIPPPLVENLMAGWDGEVGHLDMMIQPDWDMSNREHFPRFSY
jgi:hypothetical protein